ncbi:NAD-dependent epimerase/dehydratase family protein [Acidobacteriota bacterium]
MNNRKKVLVTGANGFTGTTLIKELQGSEWEIIPMTQWEIGLKNEVTIDFCDERFMRVLQGLSPVDAVVHLGSRVGWDGSSRAGLFQPNVLAAAELVHWAKQHNSYFVFASAALICGERNPHITPGCVLNTENDYLYSKWLGEEIIRMSGIKHAILRISGIFGKDGPPHLGINKAITGALQGTPPIQNGDGKIKRNYIYVKDLCNIIKYCLDNTIEGTHLVGGSQANAIAEMLGIICDVLLPGKKPEIRPGKGGHDQLIDHSPQLPHGRSFKEAIQDIASGGQGGFFRENRPPGPPEKAFY